MSPGPSGGARGLFESVPPPVYFLLCLLAGWALGYVQRWQLGMEYLSLRLALGGALVGLAAALGAWCLVLFRRAQTSPLPFETPKALLTSGPFRLSRNPLYVALGLVLAAFAVVLDNAWVLLFVPLLVLALDRLIVPGEEAALRAGFGADYVTYCRQVRRWL